MCQDEFSKDDIYTAWKEKKRELDANKNLTEKEKKTQSEDLKMEQMKIKKHMLGNIKFIGELYKLGMLKENVINHVVSSLLKITVEREGDQVVVKHTDTVEDPIDEEDHESLCKLMITIGKIIDIPKNDDRIRAYFAKFSKVSKDQAINSRIRFMYRDLIDLRKNKWVARRKEETAKTIAEIRKDAEREEQQAQQQSQQNYRNDSRGGGNSRDRNNDGRGGE